jgi:hypothetical protein
MVSIFVGDRGFFTSTVNDESAFPGERTLLSQHSGIGSGTASNTTMPQAERFIKKS